MSKLKNIMVIMNPSSGLSDSGKFKEKIEEQLSKYFEEVRIEETQRKGHACELAKEASEKRFDSILEFLEFLLLLELYKLHLKLSDFHLLQFE